MKKERLFRPRRIFSQDATNSTLRCKRRMDLPPFVRSNGRISGRSDYWAATKY